MMKSEKMNIREIIEIRDKLKSELAVVEKFLEIAKRQGLQNGDSAGSGITFQSSEQTILSGVVEQTKGGYGSIGKTVWEAIKICPTEFTVTDIAEALKELKRGLNQNQIAVALNRFRSQKKIGVISHKVGRKAAIYRRI